MGQTIACANQKGGVGKTTTVVNLATYLALAGDRVLIVDLDPQGNATSGFGIDRRSGGSTLEDVLAGDQPAREAVRPTSIDRLEILAASVGLAGAEVELATSSTRERRLERALDGLDDDHDYVLLDCPPSLGLLTVNALTAADSLLVPIQCEYFALEGVTELFDTLARIRRVLNPALTIEGLLLTMYDERTNLSGAVAADLRDFYGQQVLTTFIPRNVRLAEAPSYGKPIILYDIRSRGAESYLQLAKEVMTHDKKSSRQGVERAAVGHVSSDAE